jgi:hypothetical protein
MIRPLVVSVRGAAVLTHPLSEVAVLAGQTTQPMRKIEPKGEITMGNAFAISFVTLDGVMPSPRVFQ